MPAPFSWVPHEFVKTSCCSWWVELQLTQGVASVLQGFSITHTLPHQHELRIRYRFHPGQHQKWTGIFSTCLTYRYKCTMHVWKQGIRRCIHLCANISLACLCVSGNEGYKPHSIYFGISSIITAHYKCPSWASHGKTGPHSRFTEQDPGLT